MVLSEFLSHVSSYKWVNFVGMEDFADKLSFNVSTSLLLLITIVITIKSYLLTSIACYIPIQPSGKDFDDFLKSYCWVHGTIPINQSVPFPSNKNTWKELDQSQRISYYQWVPFVLALQGILFYLPRILWQIMTYNMSGADLEGLVEMANSASNQTGDPKKETVNQIAQNLENIFFCHRKINFYSRSIAIKVSKAKSWFCAGKRSGKQLIVQYMFIKLLYVINVMGQLFLMQRFLNFGNKGEYFGYTILKNMIDGREWNDTQIFPRVTYCYVKRIQHVGMENDYIAQCALPINMLNEKVYVFLWFWTVIVAIFTFVSVFQWIFRLLLSTSEIGFLKKFLRVKEAYQRDDSACLKTFCEGFLRKDGVFIIRMLSMNAGDLITSDIVTELWNIYKEKYPSRNFGKYEVSNDNHSDSSTLPIKDEFL